MMRVFFTAVLLILTMAFSAFTVTAEEMKGPGEAKPAEEPKPAEPTITGDEIRELEVVDSRLGAGVEGREIIGEAAEFAVNDKVYLWMKITGGSSDTVTVTWENGGGSFSTELIVGTTPWRTWAYKTVFAPGDWKVTVTDSNGKVLKEMTFKVK